MLLEAQGGLCNRLRTILSRLEPGLEVYWGRGIECAYASWDDVFEPLDGVRIVDELGSRKPDIATCHGAPIFWHERLRLLRPAAPVRERMGELLARLGGLARYDAMFIRRTDGVPVAEIERNFTPDAAFEVFARASAGPLFLATDNGETQRKVRGWVGDRVVVTGEMGGSERAELGDHTRHQPLADSVASLYLCAGARRFQGSGGSSFSHTVEALRALGIGP